MNWKNLTGRLEWALETARITQAELARRVGVSRATVSLWFSGGTKSIEGENLTRAATALNVNAHWLASGEGLPHPDVVRQTHIHHNVGSPLIYGDVPRISWVQAGKWSEVIDSFTRDDTEEWFPCPVPHSVSTFALFVRGESMRNPHTRPSFEEGDLIFIDPERSAENRSLVVVRLDDSNEATFKQLIIEGEKKYLKALNPTWPDPIIEINGSASICGVVIYKGEKI